MLKRKKKKYIFLYGETKFFKKLSDRFRSGNKDGIRKSKLKLRDKNNNIVAVGNFVMSITILIQK